MTRVQIYTTSTPCVFNTEFKIKLLVFWNFCFEFPKFLLIHLGHGCEIILQMIFDELYLDSFSLFKAFWLPFNAVLADRKILNNMLEIVLKTISSNNDLNFFPFRHLFYGINLITLFCGYFNHLLIISFEVLVIN